MQTPFLVVREVASKAGMEQEVQRLSQSFGNSVHHDLGGHAQEIRVNNLEGQSSEYERAASVVLRELCFIILARQIVRSSEPAAVLVGLLVVLVVCTYVGIEFQGFCGVIFEDIFCRYGSCVILSVVDVHVRAKGLGSWRGRSY